MGTFETFIKTGALATIALGMPLQAVMAELGTPDAQSRKANPLQLKYGALELSLWKSPNASEYKLREIIVKFQPIWEPPPPMIAFGDWPIKHQLTQYEFDIVIKRFGYAPLLVRDLEGHRELIFPSGVTASFIQDVLHDVRFSERHVKRSIAVPFTDAREPTETQIIDMLKEAEHAKKAGALRAALLLSWAGLEATLRRRARHTGGAGNIGRSPAILIQELFSEGKLTEVEHRDIEGLRQLRSTIAHGLAPRTLEVSHIVQIQELVSKLLLSKNSDY